jgi:hypothetical protein
VAKILKAGQARKSRAGNGKPHLVRWVDPDGRTREKSFASLRDARVWAAKVEHDKAQGTYVDPKASSASFG